MPAAENNLLKKWGEGKWARNSCFDLKSALKLYNSFPVQRHLDFPCSARSLYQDWCTKQAIAMEAELLKTSSKLQALQDVPLVFN